MPLDVHENLRRTLDGIVGQYELMGEQLADPEIATDHRRVQSISIRRAAMEPLAERWMRFVRL